ncbi:Hypothetical predicted protein [Pelobates cultripes]|uniref:Uncharacterized protein n=1 Tax=Pelobates cultripes TaxID=61616 RepID=A0AAD1S4E7_PELCU|nr:Hypothetical predicted protein [Pelobates cultripes]
MEETPFQKEMRTRMEFLPQPVPLEILTVLMADVPEYVMAHRPQDSPSRAESTAASVISQHTQIAGVIQCAALHSDKQSQHAGETVVIPSHLVKGVHDKFMEYLDQVPSCRKPSPKSLAVPIEVEEIWSTIQTPCDTDTTEGEIEEGKYQSQRKFGSRYCTVAPSENKKKFVYNKTGTS